LTKNIFLAICIILSISGCSYKSDYTPPEFELNTTVYKDDKNLTKEWWKSLGDKELDVFMEYALKKNLDLKAAKERIDAAYALLGQAGAGLFPDVSTGIEGSKKHTVSGSGSEAESYGYDLSMNYEIDLWGRLSAIKKSKEYDWMISQESMRQALLDISSQIAKNWYLLAMELEKKAVLEKELLIYSDILEIMNIRFLNSLVDAADIFRQNQQVEFLKAQIVTSSIKIESYKKALLLLSGKNPSEEFPYAPKTSQKLLESDVFARSDLINNRPDVKSAFLTLYSKDALLASKALDLYPKIKVGGSIFSNALEWANMFEDWVSNIFGSAALTLFDGGEKLYVKDAAKANLNEAEYLYLKSVLNAIKEVEDYSQKVNNQKEVLVHKKSQYEFSQNAYERLLERYLEGDGAYIDVLESQNSFLGIEVDMISAKNELLQYKIDMLTSLGSGMDSEDVEKITKEEE